jgi:hypothetical protein
MIEILIFFRRICSIVNLHNNNHIKADQEKKIHIIINLYSEMKLILENYRDTNDKRTQIR